MYANTVRRKMEQQNMTISKLAKETGMTYHQLYQKLLRDQFTEKDMQKIANALNCKLTVKLTNKGIKK